MASRQNTVREKHQVLKITKSNNKFSWNYFRKPTKNIYYLRLPFFSCSSRSKSTVIVKSGSVNIIKLSFGDDNNFSRSHIDLINKLLSNFMPLYISFWHFQLKNNKYKYLGLAISLFIYHGRLEKVATFKYASLHFCLRKALLDIYSLSSWPGQTLQHLPGSRMGSGHVGLGHSVLMFLQRTRPTILRFLWICTAETDIKLVTMILSRRNICVTYS